MKIARTLVAALLAFPVLCIAQVTVRFPGSERYTDAGVDQFDARKNLRDIEALFQDLGKRFLPAGQVLAIEVLDVDLAGEPRPARTGGMDLRVIRGGADWPRVKVRYRLEAGGRVSQESATIRDMAFMDRPAPPGRAGPLFYEKRMLEEWFREKFAATKDSSRIDAK